MKPRLSVHKFSSCDGCQLALLNLGEDLLRLAAQVDIVHFAEAGMVNEEAAADIALLEGSVSTPEELERLHRIRKNSQTLMTIGACAVSGGLQALRNLADTPAWTAAVYARPEHIRSLDDATPAASHVRVDLELWGCPVNGRQVVDAVLDSLHGVRPRASREKLCLSCKRRGLACVMVTRGESCLGPVTNDGCGALCPSVGRGCYGCYGPAATPNTAALSRQLAVQGLTNEQIARRFGHIHSQAKAFADAAAQARESSHE